MKKYLQILKIKGYFERSIVIPVLLVIVLVVGGSIYGLYNSKTVTENELSLEKAKKEKDKSRESEKEEMQQAVGGAYPTEDEVLSYSVKKNPSAKEIDDHFGKDTYRLYSLGLLLKDSDSEMTKRVKRGWIKHTLYGKNIIEPSMELLNTPTFYSRDNLYEVTATGYTQLTDTLQVGYETVTVQTVLGQGLTYKEDGQTVESEGIHANGQIYLRLKLNVFPLIDMTVTEIQEEVDSLGLMLNSVEGKPYGTYLKEQNQEKVKQITGIDLKNPASNQLTSAFTAYNLEKWSEIKPEKDKVYAGVPIELSYIYPADRVGVYTQPITTDKALNNKGNYQKKIEITGGSSYERTLELLPTDYVTEAKKVIY